VGCGELPGAPSVAPFDRSTGNVGIIGFVDERFATMGLFDTIREKATELLSGATDKIEEVTGNIPDVQAVEDLSETATGAVPDTTGSITDASNTVTGSITETTTETTEAVGEQIDPYRP
jgi:hypothetical protein